MDMTLAGFARIHKLLSELRAVKLALVFRGPICMYLHLNLLKLFKLINHLVWINISTAHKMLEVVIREPLIHP